MAQSKSHRQQPDRGRAKSLLAQASLAVLVVALLFANSYAVVRMLHGQPVLDLSALLPAGSDSVPAASSAVSGAGPDEGGEEEPAAEPQSWNTPTLLPSTVNQGQELVQEAHMLALPENGRVSLEYFRDALFIGDSLTEGFQLYPPLNEIAMVYGIRSASPQTFLDNGTVENKVTREVIPAIWDALTATQPGKIYLLLGTNALVNQTDEAFLHYYGLMMDQLRASFPGVPIYVQAITPTTAEKGQKTPELSNEHLHQMNNIIAQMAVSRGFYFVNEWEVLTDEGGNLRGDWASSDGMHIREIDGYRAWVDYLQTHTAYSPANLAYLEEPYVG